MAISPFKAAYDALKTFDPRKHHVNDVIEGLRSRRAYGNSGLDDKGWAVAGGLADEAVRHAALADLLISHVSTVRPDRMERPVLAALRLGIADYLRGGQAYAVVDGTVHLLPHEHAARGLVNAIMRRVTEGVTTRELTADEQKELRECGSKAVQAFLTPTALPYHNKRLIQARFALFPATLSERLELLAGIPKWLGTRLRNTLDDGEFSRTCMAAAEAPSLWLRIVRGRETIAVESLAPFRHERQGNAVRVTGEDAGPLLRSAGFDAGSLAVQDYASQLPVAAADAQDGDVCLDLCAAPGGKTCQLAEAVSPDGKVLAFDKSPDKLIRVTQNIARLGLHNVATAFGDGSSVRLPSMGTFDIVLVDAPCSNTGVLARRVEVKQRLGEKDIKSLAALQLALLNNGARHVRPGGKLVYSTCSLLDEENGALIRKFLEAQGDETSGWRMTDECLTMPAAGNHDGGYYVVMRTPEQR